MASQATAHAYGREAQQALREAIKRCKTIDGAYDPLAPVTIVAPSSVSGYHVRRAFGRLPGGLVNVQFKPLRALLELVGSGELANQGRRPLGDAYRHEAIRAVAEADRSAFGDLPIEDAMLRTLEQRFAEFDQCDDDALDLISAGGVVPRYLVDRYQAFRGLTASFYSNRDLSESAITALSGRPKTLDDIGSVIVYLPEDLTGSERRFLEALKRYTDVRVIVGLSGDAESVDNRVLDYWSAAGETSRPAVPVAQRIVQAPDPEEEVRSAIRDIAASLQSEDPTPLHRAAILYREPDPYARICAEQLDAAAVPWNGRNARTLGQSIAGSVFAGVLRLLQESTPSWASDVAPWLAAGPVRDGDGNPAPTARWNQLARSANLQRGPQDWLVRLQRYRANRQEDLERLQRDPDDERPGRLSWVRSEITQIDQLVRFTTQLADFLHDLPADAAWSEFAERTRRQLRTLTGDRNAFAQAVHLEDDDLELARWDDVEALLESLSALDDLGATTRIRFASAAARGLARQVGHHGRLGDGVYVGSLHSALGMEWDVVYIVGAAERTLPAARAEDPLLSDDLRARASLPVSRDQITRERSDFLAALHAADRRVLSYARADVRAQQARLPSRWLLESATALHGERVYASKINEIGGGAIEVTPSFEQAVTNETEYADLNEYDLAGLRRSANPAAHYLALATPSLSRGYEQRSWRAAQALTRWDGLIADGVPQAASQPHSAGALQDWATCPYRYFLGRVLHLEEREDPRDDLQITPLDKGSLIHDILERFFKTTPTQPEPGAGWSDADRDRLFAIAEDRMQHAEEQGLTGRGLLWQRDRQRILDDLRTLLDADDFHRARFQVRQIAGELTFGRLDGSAGPVELALGDGSTLPLRGRIDRIDQSDGGDLIMVIDYKTGGEFPRKRELEEDPVVGGRYLQLPIYAVAARQLLESGVGDVVRSAYWYITERGGFAFNEVPWSDENSARFGSVVDLVIESIKQGRFPANPGEEYRRTRGRHCAYCSFDAICPAERRRNWERIRLDPQLADYVELSEGERPEASES
ncbi:MAG: exodeoxyribonuclease V subunit gamma [Chloroflexi bacterium]|nr:exodeoxyribonuclease V subunit gamma [Chloroflexota bacterium]